MPTFLSPKLASAVPPSTTTSAPSGAIVAVPASVALVLASYTRSTAVTPVTSREAGVMSAVRPVGATSV